MCTGGEFGAFLEPRLIVLRSIDNQCAFHSVMAKAAQLGANGLLLEDFSDSDPVSVGTGVGSQTYTHNGSINVGVGGSLGVVKKAAKARAIFVAP